VAIVPQFGDLTRETDYLRRHGEAENGDNHQPPKLLRHLRFEAVSYRYPGRPDYNALSDISFEIAAGSSLGIIGLSGAGKTTLADLAAGLLNPSMGRVLIDGVVLEGQRAVTWRRMVSYVLQDDPLINDTVAANIRLGCADASDSDVWEALRLVCADRMVGALPDGLATVVGDRGQCLSKGQRQRICLARAIIGRPALLILDECTSGLNPVDECEFGDLFCRLAGRTTVIMISHRAATVNWVDRILVLKEGEIVEQGTPRNLRNESRSLVQKMDLIESRNDLAAEPSL
jgi:ATP-binding cassette subfamily C protein